MRWLLVAALVACGSDASEVSPDAQVPPDAYVDLSGPVFEPDHIVDVRITLPPADWDTLRDQTRTIGSVIEGDCLAQPAPTPFTKFRGSIQIDGTLLNDVAIKKKGFFGSLDETKPSLKITLDEYVKGQEYLGLEKLTLNNSHQDPSFVRQCIAYQAFAAAGMIVPRCNFAHVRVNGEDLGIYVNVETIDHHLTKKRYADGTGAIYEGTLSDLRPGWTGTFDVKGDGDRNDLVPVAQALDIANDASFEAELGTYVDLDRFYTYWAMEMVTNHWDGYANNRNNFFLYHDPTTGKLDFIPWGVDGALQPYATFGDLGETQGPVAVAANGLIAHRLFNIASARQRFLTRQRELLASVWNESALLAEIDRMEDLIAPILDPLEGTGWHGAVAGVRTFVTERRAKLTAALDAGPTWTEPLSGVPCLTVVGRVTGTFSTTWGTMDAANPFTTGAGTLTLELGGQSIPLTPVGAKAGLDPNPPAGQAAQAVVQVFGVRASDNHIIAVSMAFPRTAFVARDGDLGFFDSLGLVFDFNPATSQSSLVGFMLGTFTLTQASMTNGQPVAGSFTANADVQGAQ